MTAVLPEEAVEPAASHQSGRGAPAGSPLRFALLCPGDGREVPRWLTECAQALMASGEAELVAVLTVEVAPSATARRRQPGPLLRAYGRVLGATCRQFDLVDPAPDLPRFALGSGIAALAPDFLLACLPEEALPPLDGPALGIWRFRFGGLDPCAFAMSELPGLHEAAQGLRSIEAELLVTGGAMGAAEPRLLHRVVLKTRRSHRKTLEDLTEAAPALCLGACRRLRLGSLPAGEGGAGAGPARGATSHPLRAVAGQAWRLVQGFVERLFLRDVWNVGIVDAPIDDILRKGRMPEPRWLQPPRPLRFHADPFPFRAGGRRCLLFEMWDGAAGRGWIAAAALDGEGDGRLAEAPVAIDLGCHMSYPHVFAFGGALYCAPEVAEAGGLRLFRMGATPWEWTPVATVLEGLPLIDPTLFEHDRRWWLLAMIAGPASDRDLYAWHAATPFGPWTPHRLNPVKSDVHSARPAGAVFRTAGGDGALHRPAQDCAAGYGGAVVVNRILRLDPDHFEEAVMARITPGPNWRYPDGLHTLNLCDGLVVVDAKRRVLDPLKLVRSLAARRLRRASAGRTPNGAPPIDGPSAVVI